MCTRCNGFRDGSNRTWSAANAMASTFACIGANASTAVVPDTKIEVCSLISCVLADPGGAIARARSNALASPHRFLVNPKSHHGENASCAKLDAQVRAA